MNDFLFWLLVVLVFGGIWFVGVELGIGAQYILSVCMVLAFLTIAFRVGIPALTGEREDEDEKRERERNGETT